MSDKEQLDAELRAILPYLPGWELDPRFHAHVWRAVLIDGTGKGIHVNATQKKGTLYISGLWPTDKDNRQHIPDKPLHVGIGRRKPPEKIAADLQRRFLPWYMATYAEQAERAARHNAARNRQQEVTVELAAMLGEGTARRLQSNPNQIYASGLTVDVHGNGESVSIQLRYISLKIAKAMLRAFVKAGGLTE